MVCVENELFTQYAQTPVIQCILCRPMSSSDDESDGEGQDEALQDAAEWAGVCSDLIGAAGALGLAERYRLPV